MEEIVLKCLENITGLDGEEFKEYADMDLLEEGIIDSLCLVTLAEMLSAATSCHITVNHFCREDFRGIHALVEKVSALCGK